MGCSNSVSSGTAASGEKPFNDGDFLLLIVSGGSSAEIDQADQYGRGDEIGKFVMWGKAKVPARKRRCLVSHRQPLLPHSTELTLQPAEP